MKAILLLPALLLSPVSPEECNPIPLQDISYPVIVEHTINLINGKIDNRDELIQAMAFIESGGNSEILGDLDLGAPSVGLLQIRPIMVREVNRILKNQGLDKKFKNQDRKNADKSIEMFNIWADAYHLNSSYEKMARNWNGGPRGYKKSATVHYWAKVSTYATNNL
jgi:hypothetical protein